MRGFKRRRRVLEDDADARAQALARACRCPRSSFRRSRSIPPPAGTRPSAARRCVDLPEPDSPTRPRISPGCDRRRHSSTARNVGLPRRGTRRRGRARRAPASACAESPAAPRARSPSSRTGQARTPRCGTAASSACVYSFCGRASTWSAVPVSTMWPSRMTTTRSARSATTPMSWVISRIAESSRSLSVAQQVEDLGLHGDVERRGGLVGDEQHRIAGERHRDHDALPLAAGELVRVQVEPPLRIRDVDQRHQLDDPRAWPAAERCRELSSPR